MKMPFVLPADAVRASFHKSTNTIHVGDHSFSPDHARRIAYDILELLRDDATGESECDENLGGGSHSCVYCGDYLPCSPEGQTR